MILKTTFIELCAVSLISIDAIAQKKLPVIVGKTYTMTTAENGCELKLTVLTKRKSATIWLNGKSHPATMKRSTENEGWTYFISVVIDGKKSRIVCTFQKDGGCGTARMMTMQPSEAFSQCSGVNEFALSTCK